MRPTQKNHRPEFWLVLMRCAQAAALTDVTFFVLFHILGSPILAWINIVSVGIYGIVYYALKNRKHRVAVVLIWSEVILHAALGIALIGWESGFHYYLLMFIPAICLSTSLKPAVMALLMLFAFYTGLNFLTWFVQPIQPIDPFALKIVHIFNSSVVFIMFSYLSFFYLNTVRRAQHKLNVLATTDPLTTLLNRRHMSYLVDKEIEQFNRTNHGIGIALFDLDYFKNINDQHGHKVGDDVLIHVAKIIKNALRKQDLVARWGGEEFLVIFPETNLDETQSSAQRIRQDVLAYDWLNAIGVDIQLTISVGVSQFKQSEYLNSALARADEALYKSKAGGRNRLEFA